MLTLKNRNQAPPNGFWVWVSQTDYRQQFWGFDMAVRALLAHIRQNPGLAKRFPQLPQTKEAAEQFVDHQNAVRIANIPGAESYVQEGGPVPAGTFPVPNFVPEQPRRKCCGRR